MAIGNGIALQFLKAQIPAGYLILMDSNGQIVYDSNGKIIIARK